MNLKQNKVDADSSEYIQYIYFIYKELNPPHVLQWKGTAEENQDRFRI